MRVLGNIAQQDAADDAVTPDSGFAGIPPGKEGPSDSEATSETGEDRPAGAKGKADANDRFYWNQKKKQAAKVDSFVHLMRAMGRRAEAKQRESLNGTRSTSASASESSDGEERTRPRRSRAGRDPRARPISSLTAGSAYARRERGRRGIGADLA